MLAGVLAGGDIGQAVREPLPGENRAGGRFQFALRSLEHHHVIGFASRLEDARYHRDQKHRAGCLRVGSLLSAKVREQPRIEARCAVPIERLKIIAHRMVGTIARTGFDRVAHCLMRNPFQSGLLHPFLQVSNIFVGERPRLRVAAERYAYLMHQHRRAQHLVIGESVDHCGIVAQGD